MDLYLLISLVHKVYTTIILKFHKSITKHKSVIGTLRAGSNFKEI